MDIHQNARLTPKGRAALVRRILVEGSTAKQAAAAFGVSERTARRWLGRFRSEGLDGLRDRSSAPLRSPRKTPDSVAERITALRRQRWSGRRIAAETGLSPATVSRILRRRRLSRLRDLEPAAPIQRYERARPGELLHLDIKKLGRFDHAGHRVTGNRSKRCRGAGWEYLHIAIDDHTRLAFVRLLPDETAASAGAFLRAAYVFFRRHGVRCRRLLTDNGSCYRSRDFRTLCGRLGIGQRFTRPYTPRTNGKAERFIQTALREWAYARSYSSSSQRELHLLPWLHDYNWHRPHASLRYHPPVCRLQLRRNNLLRLHT